MTQCRGTTTASSQRPGYGGHVCVAWPTVRQTEERRALVVSPPIDSRLFILYLTLESKNNFGRLHSLFDGQTYSRGADKPDGVTCRFVDDEQQIDVGSTISWPRCSSRAVPPVIVQL
ncbi:unnamed protein product [Caenorhabditis auriculariae]|uniref:Uncharacterized protein n=1 Tax=Caenorhabditis auriculariae TaxID=2777116 RepID=A0A8S1H7T0_9PELO|nr:unnamed protein product [Caenorhabditis auriculariae]